MTRAESVHTVDVDAINYLNIALMVMSVVIAARVPFETFLAAYAVLGPLHYLTEISWLHDRGYFTRSSKDWWILAAAAVAAGVGYMYRTEWTEFVPIFALAFTFVFAIGLVFKTPGQGRAVFALLGIAAGLLALLSAPVFIVFSLLLPTLIHVYVFTGFFILYGACKGRSVSGVVSLIVFLIAPLVCLYGLDTPESYVPSPYVLDSASPFDALRDFIVSAFGLPAGRPGELAFMRLMGFAYSYHYLNWFSKTRIINWHKVSRARVSVIGAIYLGSVGLYAVDYRLGFLVLVTLSIAHVVLEFPLNIKTIAALVDDGWRAVMKKSVGAAP